MVTKPILASRASPNAGGRWLRGRKKIGFVMKDAAQAEAVGSNGRLSRTAAMSFDRGHPGRLAEWRVSRLSA